MNCFAISTATVTQNATVTKLVDITSSDSLNGMTTLDDSNIFVETFTTAGYIRLIQRTVPTTSLSMTLR